jgi:diguanylate cyclase (GGDEF)-like protein
MTSTIRTEDVLARYGGEEFAVICREIGVEGATALGERLRVAVESHCFEHDGQVIAVTVSVGVAVGQKIDDTHALIAAADAAMYDAKRAGRNRVCLSSGLKTG